MSSESDTDSDYFVEEHVKTNIVTVPLINNEEADLLGNFDDSKRKAIATERFRFDENYSSSPLKNSSEEDVGDESDEIVEESLESEKSLNRSNELTTNQITNLLRGANKANRFVLYVTNLNFSTDSDRLKEIFSNVGTVKSVRIPKNRSGGFAFVEMQDLEGFKNAFSLHNSKLDGRVIKVQLSEGGKKKSANKKNILKQKNRKLAKMRNETKKFTKSGKNFDKSIKKEIEKEMVQRARIKERKKKRNINKKNLM